MATVHEQRVLDYLCQRLRATDRQIAEGQGLPLDTVTGTVHRLLKSGVLEECALSEDADTGQLLRVVRLARKAPERDRMAEYNALYGSWNLCERCSLSTSRRNVVFGKGNLRSRYFFVGTAPGIAEDISGMPFCGTAGRELERWASRYDFDFTPKGNSFVANILCCRPVDSALDRAHRAIRTAEVESCLPHLTALLDIVYPQYVVLLGREVAMMFFRTFNVRFPRKSNGVWFFCVSDPGSAQSITAQEHGRYCAQMREEWGLLSRSVRETQDDQQTPQIVWSLPQVVRVD